MQHREVTLAYLIDNNLPVYVRNNLSSENHGVIAVEYVSRDGRGSTKIIPNSRLPYPIEKDIPRSDLQNCTDFHQMLEKKILVLLDPDEVAAMRNNPDIKAEMDRLLVSSLSADAPASRKAPVIQPQNKIFPKTIGIVDMININDITIPEALEELKRLQISGNLTGADYEHVLHHCQAQELQNWARRELTRYRGGEPEPEGIEEEKIFTRPPVPAHYANIPNPREKGVVVKVEGAAPAKPATSPEKTSVVQPAKKRGRPSKVEAAARKEAENVAANTEPANSKSNGDRTVVKTGKKGKKSK